jgi:ferritin-like metal-binding protein YciE
MPTQNNLKDLFSETLKDIYFAEQVMRFGPGDRVATTLKSSNDTCRSRSTKHALGRSALQRLSRARLRRSAS